jgi:hypothetical protein
MNNTFPVQLELENALAGDPISLERIQNDVIRQSLEQIRQQSTLQRDSITTLELQVTELATILKRRTSQWTPAKAHCTHPNSTTSSAAMQVVARQLIFDGITHGEPSESSSPSLASESVVAPLMLAEPFDNSQHAERASEDTGMYSAEDESLRGFIVPSPRSNKSPRPRTAVDLVLPPLIAFRASGKFLAAGFHSHSYLLNIFQVMIYSQKYPFSEQTRFNGRSYLEKLNGPNASGMFGSHQAALTRNH